MFLSSTSVLKLVLQFLKENNLTNTVKTLQEESNVTLNTVDNMDHFTSDIVNGRKQQTKQLHNIICFAVAVACRCHLSLSFQFIFLVFCYPVHFRCWSRFFFCSSCLVFSPTLPFSLQLNQFFCMSGWDNVLQITTTLRISTTKLIDLYEQIVLELAELRELDTARALLRQTPVNNNK